MGIKNPYVRKALGMACATGGAVLRATIDWRAIYCDPAADTVSPQHQGRFVYAGWHECMLMPILMRGDPRMLALASESGDGDIISVAMKHLGWSTARGSSSRGGVSAMFQMLRDDDRHLNLTPDGPRGPRRVMSLGPIFLASKLGIPIACVGYGYDRPWRFRSWDKFAVPKPFSRARAVFGPPLRVPARLDREGLEQYRAWFESLLNWLTNDAEAWAESGQRRPGEAPMLVGRASAPLLKWDPALAVRLPESLTETWATLPGSAPLQAVNRAA